ncbi:MAG: hypothetical protein WDW36_009914 [Sanguina aurantia]
MHVTTRIGTLKAPRSVWPTSRICLVACLLLTVLYQLHPLHYPTEQRTCQEAAPPLHGGGIPRHPAAIELAKHLDMVWDLGACFRNTSKLHQWLPPSRCLAVDCLSSAACGSDVDLSVNLLDDLAPAAGDTRVGTLERQQHASSRGLPKPSHPLRPSPPNGCPAPSGGQSAPHPHTSPEVSFLIYVSDEDILLGVHSLVELFNTAAEVTSAEYIILHDARAPPSPQQPGDIATHGGSSGGSEPDSWQPLTLAIQRLHVHFGAALHLVRHPPAAIPRGYSTLMMEGARLATGATLGLLDGRTLVAHGWLGPLMSVLATRPNVAAVGPLMIRSGGMLVAAAGGIVWSGGNVTGFQAGAVASHDVTYGRRVDFVPAGAMLVRRAAFMRAGGLRQDMGGLGGGLDGPGAAGEYAHASLGLSLGQLGLHSYYQPLGVVVQAPRTPPSSQALAAAHLALQTSRRERSSAPAAPDPSTPQERFLSAWGATLEHNSCDLRSVPQAVAARSHSGSRILWVDDIIPEPDRDSGSIRTAAILDMLVADAFDVTYQPSTPRGVEYMLATQWAGVDVLPAWAPERWAESMHGGCPFDLVVVARRAVYQKWATQLESLCKHVPWIYDTVDVHFLREARDQLSSSESIHAAGFSFATLSVASVVAHLDALPADNPLRVNQAAELDIIRRAGATLVVSPTEVDLLQHYAPSARVFVVSNIHTRPAQPARAHTLPLPQAATTAQPQPALQGLPCAQRHGLLFVGNLQHRPNQAAILYLITDVLPVLQEMPDSELNRAQLHIVGSNQLPWEVQAVVDGCSSVRFHGWLGDDALEALYGQVTGAGVSGRVKVAVAPLLSGAGVKGKVNQAMKYAVPVVATSVAVEGMHVTHGVECLVADTPQQIAAAIATLHADCATWGSIALAGARNVAQHFSSAAAHAALMQAMAAVGVHPRPAGQEEARSCS